MKILTDSDVTMIATKQFNSIVNEIQNSGLNYSLQVSPFSALISLRKTLVKDLSGSYIIPSQCQNEHCSCSCKNKLSSLQKKYEEISAAHELANETIGKLSNMIKERNKTINDLLVANEACNKEVLQNQVRYQQEKSSIFTEHQSEITAWKKDLSDVIDKHKSLEYKYQLLSEKHEVSGKSPDFQPTIERLPQPATHTDLFLSLVDNFCSSGISEEVEAKPYYLRDTDNLSSTILDNMEPPESVSTIECSPSLASHWVSPEEYSPQSLSDIASFKSHCARLNNPGDVFDSKAALEKRFNWLLEDHRRKHKDTCKQS